MVRRIISVLISFVTCTVLIFEFGLPTVFADNVQCTGCTITDPTVEEAFTKGDGTADDPWQIETIQQLNHVRKHLDGHFIQMVDLDLTGFDLNGGGETNGNFDPIGGNDLNTLYLPGSSEFRLSGTYDGNGKTVIGLTIQVPHGYCYTGLFGIVGSAGRVMNLALENSNTHACYFAGSLVGVNEGTVINCSNRGSFSCESFSGGLIGYNRETGLVQNCSNAGEVSCLGLLESSTFGPGGLLGENYGTIRQSINSATVMFETYQTGGTDGGICSYNSYDSIIEDCINTGHVTGDGQVAGICPLNFGSISGCTNEGNVTGKYMTGGISGQDSGTVENCINEGEIAATLDSVGGITGFSCRQISNCRNTGDVIGRDWVGGIVGDNGGNLQLSFNTGKVEGRFYLGGVAGLNRSNGIMENCYNTGDVSGSSAVGGVVSENTKPLRNCYSSGKNHVSNGNNYIGNVHYLDGGIANYNGDTITKCYFKEEEGLTGVCDPRGDANGNAVAMSEPEMKKQAFYEGWDFDNVWMIDANVNNGYPILRAFHPDLTENADLWSIIIDSKILACFSPEKTDYTLNVPYITNSVEVSAETMYGNANIISGTGKINLNVGTNLNDISVKLKDGETKAYHLNINRIGPSHNNDLSTLIVNGESVPGFNPAVISYEIAVASTTTSIDVNAQPNDSMATVSGTGTFNLTEGTNTVNITVHAQSGDTKTYSLNIQRNLPAGISIQGIPMSSVFDMGISRYTASVPYSVSSINLRYLPTTAGQTYKGQGIKKLKPGSNTFYVYVKDIKKKNKKYTVRVYRALPSRNNKLASLSINGSALPNFQPNRTSYTLTTVQDISSVNIAASVQDPTATIQKGEGTFPLKNGKNYFKIIVKAQNGAKMTVTIKITKSINVRK